MNSVSPLSRFFFRKLYANRLEGNEGGRLRQGTETREVCRGRSLPPSWQRGWQILAQRSAAEGWCETADASKDCYQR